MIVISRPWCPTVKKRDHGGVGRWESRRRKGDTPNLDNSSWLGTQGIPEKCFFLMSSVFFFFCFFFFGVPEQKHGTHEPPHHDVVQLPESKAFAVTSAAVVMMCAALSQQRFKKWADYTVATGKMASYDGITVPTALFCWWSLWGRNVQSLGLFLFLFFSVFPNKRYDFFFQRQVHS